MNFKRILAASILFAILTALIPAAPVRADGAARTRNLLLGGAAAALLIVNHNRKVHERYAEYDRRNAALAQQRNDAWAAYRSSQAAYEHEATVAAQLEREVTYQHQIIQLQRRQLAQREYRRSSSVRRVAKTPAPILATVRVHRNALRARQGAAIAPTRLALVSYGWGTI